MVVFLTGFMGSGKTHWGRLWAEASDYIFVDLDEKIAEDTGTSIVDLFEKKGEEYFREVEAKVLRQLDLKPGTIVACGGGAPCFHDNMNWMNASGKTIYLRASPKFLWDRIRDEREVRPLLKNLNENELLFFIEKKLAEREPFYNQAQIILNADELRTFTLQQILKDA